MSAPPYWLQDAEQKDALSLRGVWVETGASGKSAPAIFACSHGTQSNFLDLIGDERDDA